MKTTIIAKQLEDNPSGDTVAIAVFDLMNAKGIEYRLHFPTDPKNVSSIWNQTNIGGQLTINDRILEHAEDYA